MKHRWMGGHECIRCGLQRVRQGRPQVGFWFLYRTHASNPWSEDLPRCHIIGQVDLFSSARLESKRDEPDLEEDFFVLPPDAPELQLLPKTVDTDVSLMHVSHSINDFISLEIDQHSRWFGRPRIVPTKDELKK